MFRNLLVSVFVFVVSSFGVYFSLDRLDPFLDGGWWVLVLFFVLLFLCVTSFFSLLLFFGEEVLERRELGEKYFLKALRRGGLVSCFVVCVGLLRFFLFLDFFSVLLLFVFFALVELVFVMAKN